MDTKKICQTAVLAAFVFVVTRFIQIPIPFGYFNIGNVIILIACILLPSPYGIFVGAIGSALADLTSYPVYTLPTLLIKALFPLVFYMICKRASDSNKTCILACAVSTLIPLFGYTITGGILYGNIITGFAQFPGLLLEYGANLALFALCCPQVRKLRQISVFRQA